MATRSRKPPWERPDPAQQPTKLTDDEKSTARKRARRAGRRYPNLVDNMAVAAKHNRKAKGSRRKRATRGSTSNRRTRDPRGGLTAAGREAFRRKQGSRLQAAVALSAHAWGEPVPKTEAAARKIAEKGRRLLARYKRAAGA